MPPAIAAEHDSYLKRHLDTGHINVIGAMGRHLVAQHAGGSLLSVSLTVEEERVGGAATYHGTVRALAGIEGIVLADMEGKIIEVNAGLCFLLGYRERELLQRNVTKLMPRKFRKNHPASLRRFVETGVPHFTGTRQTVPVVRLSSGVGRARMPSGRSPLPGRPLAAHAASPPTPRRTSRGARRAVRAATTRAPVANTIPCRPPAGAL